MYLLDATYITTFFIFNLNSRLSHFWHEFFSFLNLQLSLIVSNFHLKNVWHISLFITFLMKIVLVCAELQYLAPLIRCWCWSVWRHRLAGRNPDQCQQHREECVGTYGIALWHYDIMTFSHEHPGILRTGTNHSSTLQDRTHYTTLHCTVLNQAMLCQDRATSRYG